MKSFLKTIEHFFSRLLHWKQLIYWNSLITKLIWSNSILSNMVLFSLIHFENYMNDFRNDFYFQMDSSITSDITTNNKLSFVQYFALKYCQYIWAHIFESYFWMQVNFPIWNTSNLSFRFLFNSILLQKCLWPRIFLIINTDTLHCSNWFTIIELIIWYF